jgi:hypothetical protein
VYILAELCAPYSVADITLAVFGLQNVTHTDDAASALQLAPWSWQELAPAAGAHQVFFDVRYASLRV